MTCKSIDQLLCEINQLSIRSPSFVVADRRDRRIAVMLVKKYGGKSNFAIVEEIKNYFLFGNTLILYGQVNSNVILLVRDSINRIRYMDIYDLVKCAGAKMIKAININVMKKSQIYHLA